MIVSLSLLPSVHDQYGQSRGLCGTLDNDASNDFHDQRGHALPDASTFIKTWRLDKRLYIIDYLKRFSKASFLSTLPLCKQAKCCNALGCFVLDFKTISDCFVLLYCLYFLLFVLVFRHLQVYLVKDCH